MAGIEGFSWQYEVIGPRSVLVSWRMGDGSVLRLYTNLDDDAQGDLPPIIGRRVYLQGFADGGRLRPWTALWTIAV